MHLRLAKLLFSALIQDVLIDRYWLFFFFQFTSSRMLSLSSMHWSQKPPASSPKLTVSSCTTAASVSRATGSTDPLLETHLPSQHFCVWESSLVYKVKFPKRSYCYQVGSGSSWPGCYDKSKAQGEKCQRSNCHQLQQISRVWKCLGSSPLSLSIKSSHLASSFYHKLLWECSSMHPLGV